MKIVLTSSGIINKTLKEEFLSLFNKKPENIKMLYITTAIDGEKSNDIRWLEEEFNTILKLGILKENIIEYKIGNELIIDNYDVIYMMGGNTFYLLDQIRKFNFDSMIKKALENDIVYVGSSAGSIIMGKTIDVALPYDENNVGINNFTGLSFIDGVIIPHANRKQDFIKKYKKNSKDKLIILNDGDGNIYNTVMENLINI